MKEDPLSVESPAPQMNRLGVKPAVGLLAFSNTLPPSYEDHSCSFDPAGGVGSWLLTQILKGQACQWLNID